MEKYVAFICDTYRKKSFHFVLKAVKLYNLISKDSVRLLIVGVPLVEYMDDDAFLNIGFTNWEHNDYLKKITFMIVDYENQLNTRELLNYMNNKVPCIVNETCRQMKQICVENNCGIYYSNLYELLAGISFFCNPDNFSMVEEIAGNALAYAGSELNNEKRIPAIKERCETRKQKLNRLIQKLDSLDQSPEQKLKEISGQLRSSDRPLNLICLDELSKNNMQTDILMIYYYIKRYINPNCKMFFDGNIDTESIFFQLLVQQGKVLGVNDIYFNYPEEYQDNILLTSAKCENFRQRKDEFRYIVSLGNGAEEDNMVYAEDCDVSYVAELIGSLLY